MTFWEFADKHIDALSPTLMVAALFAMMFGLAWLDRRR